MSKFTPLADYCREQSLKEFELSFLQIEAIIGSKLDTRNNHEFGGMIGWFSFAA